MTFAHINHSTTHIKIIYYILCMQMNDTGSGCNMLELAVPEPCGNLQLTVSGTGHTVKGYAEFDGPILTGKITFVSGK